MPFFSLLITARASQQLVPCLSSSRPLQAAPDELATPLIRHCLSQARTRLRRQLADLACVWAETEKNKGKKKCYTYLFVSMLREGLDPKLTAIGACGIVAWRVTNGWPYQTTK